MSTLRIVSREGIGSPRRRAVELRAELVEEDESAWQGARELYGHTAAVRHRRGVWMNRERCDTATASGGRGWEYVVLAESRTSFGEGQRSAFQKIIIITIYKTSS